ITVTGPAKMQKPSAESLLATVIRAAAKTQETYRDNAASTPLLDKLPEPGKIVATENVPEIGVTVWKLQNGARVIFKPTDFKNDEVRMSAFSPGGHSLASDADFDSARFADAIVDESGLGSMNATQLRKALAGKIVHVRPWINELE